MSKITLGYELTPLSRAAIRKYQNEARMILRHFPMDYELEGIFKGREADGIPKGSWRPMHAERDRMYREVDQWLLRKKK